MSIHTSVKSLPKILCGYKNVPIQKNKIEILKLDIIPDDDAQHTRFSNCIVHQATPDEQTLEMLQDRKQQMTL